jgi:hypothetical protein
MTHKLDYGLTMPAKDLGMGASFGYENKSQAGVVHMVVGVFDAGSNLPTEVVVPLGPDRDLAKALYTAVRRVCRWKY